jgi:hypothetical protein
MARIISRCTCGTTTIRDYAEVTWVKVTDVRVRATQSQPAWIRLDTAEPVCLAYEQSGCGRCRWHPKGCNGLCPKCGNRMGHTFKRTDIKASFSERVKCGRKCHTATSASCDCECAGTNHGKALRIHQQVTV